MSSTKPRGKRVRDNEDNTPASTTKRAKKASKDVDALEPASKPRRGRSSRSGAAASSALILEQTEPVTDIVAGPSSVPEQAVDNRPTALERRSMLFLLRAVNVGGSNACNMRQLVQLCADTLDWNNARTYLQSGNLVADVPSSLSTEEAAQALHQALEDDMRVHSVVMYRTLSQLEDMVAKCPYGTTDPTRVHGFFLNDMPSPDGLAKLAAKPAKDDKFESDGGLHLYLSYPNGAGKAALSGSVIERALGVSATARNWRTVLALRDMMRA